MVYACGSVFKMTKGDPEKGRKRGRERRKCERVWTHKMQGLGLNIPTQSNQTLETLNLEFLFKLQASANYFTTEREERVNFEVLFTKPNIPCS